MQSLSTLLAFVRFFTSINFLMKKRFILPKLILHHVEHPEARYGMLPVSEQVLPPG